ncbi:hypothetical protein L3X38_042788 [Prunus dulcis]|uniref:Uncharacterized protein n=1 Tax=Prunus dulcis TaxID=3755 RepID=A0AAD4YKM5_PRUDU|nr:hypothetical protein L3X38_042788 [Prunus dulcis]
MPPSFCVASVWSCRASQDKSSLFCGDDQLGGTRLVDIVTGGRRLLERRWPLVAAERVSEKVGGLPPAQAATSRAKNVSPLRKKPRIPSIEKSQVGAVPPSSAKVKHLVGADW